MPNATLLALTAALVFASSSAADLAPDPEADVPHEDGLSGRDVYDRVVENRLRAFELTADLENGNGHGDARRMRFRIAWKDYRDEDRQPTRGVVSKTKIELEEPFDLRFGGLLIVQNDGSPSETWVYASVFRRTFRYPIRGETIHGSDFTFDDLVPPEVEDFVYRRIADGVFEGEPVFVVELVPRPNAGSDHSRILVSVDKARDVVVRARYWNASGAETKELSIPPSSLERFGESWFPMRAKMKNLATGSYTLLVVADFDPNPDLDRRVFDLGRLESK